MISPDLHNYIPQYAAAQATAAAAAQFYANAAMNAAGGNGAVLLPAGGQMGHPQYPVLVSQAQPPQVMSLPASHTWSGREQGAPPPPPAPPSYSQHDDRDTQSYTGERRDRRDRSGERRRERRARSRSRSRSRSERRRSRSRSRGRDREEYRERRGRDRDRDRSPRRERYRAESPPSEDDWKNSSPNNTIMIRGLPQYVTEQHVSLTAPELRNDDYILTLQVQDNIASHGLEVKDIRLIRKKDTGIVTASFTK